MPSRNVILRHTSFLNVGHVLRLLVLGEDVGPLQCYKKQEAFTSSP